MIKIDADLIAIRLTEYYGLPLVGRKGKDENGDEYVELVPAGVHINDSFSVRITIGWRSLSGMFIPGAFAASMIGDMGRASDSDKMVFSEFVTEIQKERGSVQMQVNGNEADPVKFLNWPANW